MAAQIGRLDWGDYEVAKPFRDRSVTPRALVSLSRLVGLNKSHSELPKRFRILHAVALPTSVRHANSAQATTRVVMRIAEATKTKSCLLYTSDAADE